MKKHTWPDNNKKPAIIRYERAREEYLVPTLDVEESPSISPFPPWDDNPPVTHLDIDGEALSRDLPERLLRAAFETMEATTYGRHFAIFTDGSKLTEEDPRVACAAYIPKPNTTLLCRLRGYLPITSAELQAIYIAIKWISHNLQNIDENSIIVYSDSQTALRTVSQRRTTNPTVIKLRAEIETIKERGKIVQLQWSPAHIGIEGNERADTAAKLATNLPLENVTQTSIEKDNIKSPQKEIR